MNDDRLSPKQLEELLDITKSQLHHWEKHLDLTPVERSYGRGLSTVYSRENLFVLLLLRRLFLDYGFTLQTAVGLVKKIVEEIGMGRLQEVPEVTVMKPVTEAEKYSQPKPPRARRRFFKLRRNKTERSELVGSLTIPLQDLQEVAHGPVN